MKVCNLDIGILNMRLDSNHKAFATLLFVLVVLIMTCIMYTLSIRKKTHFEIYQYHQPVYVMQKLELLAIEMIRTDHVLPFHQVVNEDFVMIQQIEEYYYIHLYIQQRTLIARMHISDSKITYEYVESYPLID